MAAAASAALYIIVYGILGVITAMFIVYFFPMQNCAASRQTEGFADGCPACPVCPGAGAGGSGSGSGSGSGAGSLFGLGVSSCPRGTKSFTDRNGNISCCTGSVNGNTCEGTVTCTLSGTANLTSGIPFCPRSPMN